MNKNIVPITTVLTAAGILIAGCTPHTEPSINASPARAVVTEEPVEIPAEHRAAAEAAAARHEDYRWTSGCHSYVRTMRGAVYWVQAGKEPNIKTWEVGRRGWPQGGCMSPTTPESEPCDRKGVPVCGVGGTYAPGITDGTWGVPPDAKRVPA